MWSFLVLAFSINNIHLGNNHNLTIQADNPSSSFRLPDYLLQVVAWSAVILLFSGFLFSRLFMNIGFLLCGIYILSHTKRLYFILKNKWIWTFAGLALIHVVDDAIRTGLGMFLQNGMIKLILILLPVFILVWNPNRMQIQKVNIVFIAFIFLGSCYSLWNFALDTDQTLLGYSQAKVMAVPAYGDHIRFSWAVVISCLLSIYQIADKDRSNWRFLYHFNVIVQVLFLHILGAKTGLVVLYLTIPLLAYFSLSSARKFFALLTVPLIALLMWLAYIAIPSFKNRVDFIRYDFSHYVEGDYRLGLSDGLRVYSIKAGMESVKEAPLFGVGFSNLGDNIEEWYQRNMPEVPASDYFLPSSQYIIYLASAGIFGIALFLWHILYPFSSKEFRRNRWFLLFYIPAIFTFFFETHLEGQISVFIYAFFLAWFYSMGKNVGNDPKIGL
jgi:O-antigen ligase